VDNFGWPCYEGGSQGSSRQAGYQSANLNVCESLYASGAGRVVAPYYAYDHAAQIGSGCQTGSSSISGLAFYEGGSYPGRYDGALFFADFARKCIWAMEKGANGLPDPTKIATFVAGAAGPVDLEIGPGGDLFYADLDSGTGTVRRIKYFAANQPPVARATANPTNGSAPLTVSFDATASTDADGDALSYAWDLDGDAGYDDSTLAKPTHTYPSGSYEVGLRVTDSHGATDTLDAPLTISVGNTPPTVTIRKPLSTTTWKVGDTISFSGSATDRQDGALGPSKLSWSLILHHCYSADDCHKHPVQNFSGVARGSFVAPDHEYPAYRELRLTATDSGGLTSTKRVRLDPRTVVLGFRTNPTGLKLVVGSRRRKTPFSRTVIVGSTNSVSAISPQTLGGTSYRFQRWSDGGAQSHNIVAPASATTYTATYKRR
jgi:PKD repeat protein